MSEPEMSMDEILSSIRSMLSDEVGQGVVVQDKIDEEVEEIFILTPQMRCDTVDDLKERMQRVLNKMANQQQSGKAKTMVQELQPLLKDWMIQMRPDLTNEQLEQELHKILPTI
jgi:hypothetical protein